MLGFAVTLQVGAAGKTYEVTIMHVRPTASEDAPRGCTIEIRSPEGWIEAIEHVETDEGFRFFLDAASEHRDEVREVVKQLPPLAPHYKLA
jgi:hypothetical protein